MGVANKQYSKAAIESALFRSSGVPLKSYAYGPATNPDSSAKGSNRRYVESGKKVGHVYIHVKGGGDDVTGRQSDLENRSRFADLNTTLSALVEVMKHPRTQAALVRLDSAGAAAQPGDPNAGHQEWLHGNHKSDCDETSCSHNVEIDGAWYGYPQNSDALQQIKTVAINMRSHGDALFISSAYPEDFTT